MAMRCPNQLLIFAVVHRQVTGLWYLGGLPVSLAQNVVAGFSTFRPMSDCGSSARLRDSWPLAETYRVGSVVDPYRQPTAPASVFFRLREVDEDSELTVESGCRNDLEIW